MKVKLANSISKTVTTLQKAQLRQMISLKYMDKRKFDDTASTARENLDLLTVPIPLLSRINTIIEELCAKEKEMTSKKHRKKYDAMAKEQRTPPTKVHLAHNPPPPTFKQTPCTKSGVIISTAATFSNEVIPILEKGAKYKLTPSKKEMTNSLRRGTERLAIAMRYANPEKTPSFKDDVTSTETTDTAPVEDSSALAFPINQQVIAKFNKTTIFPPPRATKKTEATIKTLKSNQDIWKKHISSSSIKQNYNATETEQLEITAKQENIQIEPTDKTSKIAIIDKTFATNKISDHLGGPGYEQLDDDPTQAYEKEYNTLVKRICSNKEVQLPESLQKNLHIKHSSAPPIFSFQKDHKENYPDCKIRPVQPIGEAANYKADLIISKILGQILPKLKYRITNKQEYLQRLSKIKPANITFMASFDIENMFANMPIGPAALNVIRLYLHKFEGEVDLMGFRIEDVIDLLQFSLEHTYVLHNGIYYRQKNGVGTGCHPSPSYSEIIVDYIYQTAVIMTQIDPIGLSLYMDDAWLAWDRTEDSFARFHEALNNVFPGQLRFTVERELNKNINFLLLDLTIKREDELQMQYEFYQKPTHSGKYMNYDSHCAQRTKLNIIVSETKRVWENCSKTSYVHLAPP